MILHGDSRNRCWWSSRRADRSASVPSTTCLPAISGIACYTSLPRGATKHA